MVFKGERDMLYNVAVCDDDEKDRQKIKEYLSKFGIQYDVDFKIDTFMCGEDLMIIRRTLVTLVVSKAIFLENKTYVW